MENIVILGASWHAKVVVDTLEESGMRIQGIYDHIKHELVFGYPYLGNAESLVDSKNPFYIIATGDNNFRKKISFSLPISKVNAIHPTAFVSKKAEMGFGNMIMANASINTGVKIGHHCIINTNASVDHDCELADCVHISPQVGIAGNVTIGEGTHIGIGAQVIDKVKIGKWVTVGAGAVIINDIPDYAVVVGNPGKIIKYNS